MSRSSLEIKEGAEIYFMPEENELIVVKEADILFIDKKLTFAVTYITRPGFGKKSFEAVTHKKNDWIFIGEA